MRLAGEWQIKPGGLEPFLAAGRGTTSKAPHGTQMNAPTYVARRSHVGTMANVLPRNLF